MVSTSHWSPEARERRASAVTSTTSRASASATYAASYGVTTCRSSHMRSSNDRWEDRRSGNSARSAIAPTALRAGISFAATWRRHTETTSRSMSSGATNVSSARRSRACCPSGPSSPSATASTLASTTITVCPNVFGGSVKRHPAATTCSDSDENLVQSGLTRVGDQPASKVFLQGLMRAGGSFPQDSMGVFGNVFDLHTGHGAILAPLAPKRKCDRFDPLQGTHSYNGFRRDISPPASALSVPLAGRRRSPHRD